MRLSQGNFKPVYFHFLQKDFTRAQKHSHANNNKQKKVKQTLNS